MLRPERLQKILSLVEKRQHDLTVVLENVHDPHNISAVLRTCDAVGVGELHILYTDPKLQRRRYKPGKRTSSGSKKWVKIHRYLDLDQCVKELRKRYHRILVTHLGVAARDLYAYDLTTSTALVFGNEHDGVSAAFTAVADGTMHIPQVGMVDSLNISVACAVVLYEAFRQRRDREMYDDASGYAQHYNELLRNYLGDEAGPYLK